MSNNQANDFLIDADIYLGDVFLTRTERSEIPSKGSLMVMDGLHPQIVRVVRVVLVFDLDEMGLKVYCERNEPQPRAEEP